MKSTLPEFLLHWAAEAPDSIFLAEPETGAEIGYGATARRVAGLRGELRRRGIGRGDRVAVLADNGIPWVVTYLAAMAHGAVAVSLNTRQAAGDLAPVLARFDPAVIVGDDAYLARVPAEQADQALRTADLGDLANGRGIEGSEAHAEELAGICQTSGTTGEPKGVMLSHEALVRNALTFAQLFQSGPDTRTPILAPLFHNTGYNDCLAHMLVAGGRADLHRRFDAGTVGRAILAGDYGYVIAVPTMYGRMTAALEGVAPSAAAPWLAYGGAPMPAAVAERFGRLVPGARLVNVYGFSEATAITHYLPWRPGARDLAAIGVAVPGTLDRINAEGELQVRTPTAMMGYWRDERATRAKYEDGWLRTGDLAARGDDGMLRLIGRIDDLINRGGEKISPVEVEAALSAHPDVLEAAVVGLDDPDLGQVAGAAVAPRPGSGLDAAALAAFLAGRIADFKRPARFAFLDSLPRNPSGKVLKDVVRAILEDSAL